MPAVLEAKNVTKIFGGGFLSREEENVAVNNISMSLDQKNPKIIAVAGESGSGKTTLARLLLGIAAPTTGTVEYDGKDLSTISRSERREFRREVQPIFQDPYGSYNPFYKVDHVLFTPIKNFNMAESTASSVTKNRIKTNYHGALEGFASDYFDVFPTETTTKFSRNG